MNHAFVTFPFHVFSYIGLVHICRGCGGTGFNAVVVFDARRPGAAACNLLRHVTLRHRPPVRALLHTRLFSSG